MPKTSERDGATDHGRGHPRPGRVARAGALSPPRRPRSNRKRPRRPTRRHSRASAWHWRQTDRWYYTIPGGKKRAPLLDEDGARVRGKDNKE
jgi:hypothetical protein